MDIASGNSYPPDVLAKAVSLAYVGAACSTGPYGAILHIPGSDDTKANAIFQNWDSLDVESDKGVVVANDIDEATISLSIGDSQVSWMVLRNGDLVGSGTEAVVGGIVELEFSVGIAGTYQVWILRETGDFATGHVEIIAG